MSNIISYIIYKALEVRVYPSERQVVLSLKDSFLPF